MIMNDVSCNLEMKLSRNLKREKQTLEHGARHHEQPEKQDPSIPRSHLHKQDQFFSPPSKKHIIQNSNTSINTCHTVESLIKQEKEKKIGKKFRFF